MSELIDRSPRVSTLELFFDLVFVFTDHAADRRARRRRRRGLSGAGRRDARGDLVDVRRLRVADERDRDRSPAVPAPPARRDGRVPRHRARGPDGVRERTVSPSGIGYLVVVLLHGAMYAKGTSVSEVAAILRIVPYNLTAAGMVLVGGIAGGDAQDVLWLLAALLLWVHAVVHEHRGFLVAASALRRAARPRDHRRARRVGRRHRRRCRSRPLDLELVLVALLVARPQRLAVVALLPGRGRCRARDGRARRRRAAPGSRSSAFGYWHYGLLLGVVAVAAGLKKAVGHPYDQLGRLDRRRSSPSVSRSSSPPRPASGDARSRVRAVYGCSQPPLALATIPLGTRVDSAGSARRAHR